MKQEELQMMFEQANRLCKLRRFAEAIELYDAVVIGCKSLIAAGQTELNPYLLLAAQMSQAINLRRFSRFPTDYGW